MVSLRPRFRFLVAGLVTGLAAVCSGQTDISPSPSSPGASIPGTGGPSSFASSVPTQLVPGVLPLSLQDAINRGLKQNLGLLLSRADVRAARGQEWEQLSSLLPHVSAAPYVAVSKLNIDQLGFAPVTNAFNISPAIGPYSFFDVRAALNQTLFDWKAINASRAAAENRKAASYTYQDAHDLVVLAVGYTYLQAIADKARIETAEAQVKTAKALYDQAADQVTAGTSPDIDALRTKVELQTRQQQLIQAKNNFAIQKLTVARVIGLPPAQEFDFTDTSPYSPFQGITVEDALRRAFASRADYRSALSDVRSAELARKAAVGGYFPSVSFGGDYGTGGNNPGNSTQVYDVKGTVSIPIFTGNSVHGDIQVADARLEQSRERLESLRAQIESDVRAALLNLQSASDQVDVARSNIDLAQQTLTQSTDRFTAGVTDTVEVVQSQESVASANEQFISSLYNYNFAKISLIRALGIAEQGVKDYFRGN